MSATHENRSEESEFGVNFYLSSFSDYESYKTNTSQAFTNTIPTIELNNQQSYECMLSNLHIPKHIYSLAKDDPESEFRYFISISEFNINTGLWELTAEHDKVKSTHFKSYLDNKGLRVEDLNRELFSV